MGIVLPEAILPAVPQMSMLILLIPTVILLVLCMGCHRRRPKNPEKTQETQGEHANNTNTEQRHSYDLQNDTQERNTSLIHVTKLDENTASICNPNFKELTMDEIVIHPTQTNGIDSASEGLIPWRSHSGTLDHEGKTHPPKTIESASSPAIFGEDAEFMGITSNRILTMKNPHSGDECTGITMESVLVQKVPDDQAAKMQQVPEVVVTPCTKEAVVLQSGSAPLVPSQLECPSGKRQQSHVSETPPDSTLQDGKFNNEHIYEELIEDQKNPSVLPHPSKMVPQDKLQDRVYYAVDELMPPNSHNASLLQARDSQPERDLHVLTPPTPQEGTSCQLNTLYAQISRKNKSPQPLSQAPPDDKENEDDGGEEAPIPPVPERNLSLEDYQSVT